MTSLLKIEGIGPVYAAKLKGVEVATIEALLRSACTVQGRKSLAEKSGIREELLLEWANRADLFRIRGIGEEYSDLLEAAGVDTVPELSQRNPDNLYEKMAEVNREKKLVRQLPTKEMVHAWVEQAKVLPRVINY
jgi:predicted flap endonuclease-1-like 5' DNA nuclease